MFQSLIWIKWWSSAPNPSLHLQCRIQLFFSKNLPKSFSIINYVCLGYHHIHSAKQMLQIKTLPGIEFYHVYFPPDLDFSDGANDTRASIIMSTWDNCLILGVSIPHICHRRCLCKFFLPGVIFFQIEREKLAFYCIVYNNLRPSV